MRLQILPRAPLVAALVGGLASAAFAAPDAAEESRRLEDHHWFVGQLDRGWEPLLSDLDRTLTSLADAPEEAQRPVKLTADAARETVATKSLAKGETGEDRALELFGLLANSSVDRSKQPKHHASCADILMRKADRAVAKDTPEGDSAAFDLAKAALGHVKGLDRAFGMIARLGLKVGLAFREKEEYDTSLEKLRGTVETLKENGDAPGSKSITDVQAVIDDILKTTGPLSILWLGDAVTLANVKGVVADFSHAMLSFAGPGKPMPQVPADLKKPKRIRAGTWQVTAEGTNGGKWTGEATITAQGGEFLVLRGMPKDMVYVPAIGSAEAFLVDRYEVSNAQWNSLGDKPRGGSPNAAVAGVSFGEAKSWATLAGKRLPTLDQWTHAAFGVPRATSPKYPWGDDEPVAGTHVVSGVDEAQDVKSCPAGASRSSGCFNMAGNVWEWLDTGWMIGASYKLSKLTRNVPYPEGSPLPPWTADLLRNAVPTEGIWDALPDEERDRYRNYKASDATLEQAGLRCVVPLGKPWR